MFRFQEIVLLPTAQLSFVEISAARPLERVARACVPESGSSSRLLQYQKGGHPHSRRFLHESKTPVTFHQENAEKSRRRSSYGQQRKEHDVKGSFPGGLNLYFRVSLRNRFCFCFSLTEHESDNVRSDGGHVGRPRRQEHVPPFRQIQRQIQSNRREQIEGGVSQDRQLFEREIFRENNQRGRQRFGRVQVSERRTASEHLREEPRRVGQISEMGHRI